MRSVVDFQALQWTSCTACPLPCPDQLWRQALDRTWPRYEVEKSVPICAGPWRNVQQRQAGVDHGMQNKDSDPSYKPPGYGAMPRMFLHPPADIAVAFAFQVDLGYLGVGDLQSDHISALHLAPDGCGKRVGAAHISEAWPKPL